MFSQRGVINLAHSDAQMDAFARRGNAMRLNGIDGELLDRDQVQRTLPYLDYSRDVRFPILGGLLQPRGGTARHDAVAWGYARAADRLGVDIIQNCEVTDFRVSGNRVTTVETSRGPISCDRLGLAVAGSTGYLAGKLGLRLPIETHVMQAFVTEPVKPLVHHVVTYGAGHFYFSQSDKGGLVFGGDIDMYNSYAQRGNLPTAEHVITAGLAMMPGLSRLRVLRSWGGLVDQSMDGSPIISKSPIDNLYLSCGLVLRRVSRPHPGAGWTFAHTIAHDEPHPLIAGHTLDRFRTGHTIDERGSGPYPEPALGGIRMIRIKCPWCGVRDHAEFRYVGDATKLRPEPGAGTPEEWHDFVYIRDNPRGPHLEIWQHVHGCRSFLQVCRDTRTHDVLAVGLPGDDLTPFLSGNGEAA